MQPAADRRASTPIQSEPLNRVSTGFWRTATGAAVTAVIFGIMVFLVSSVADILMFYEHEPGRLAIELSDLISALVIGLLAYRLIRLQQQSREHLRQRLEIISDMNHHVRNALQVISLTAHVGNHEEITAIREGVNRIQWALRELLPKI
jgi:hypothetical protein